MKSWSAYFKILLHSLKEFRIHEYNSFNLFVMASCYAGQIGHSFFPLLFCLVFLSIRHWGLKIPFMWCQPPIILFFLFRYAFCFLQYHFCPYLFFSNTLPPTLQTLISLSALQLTNVPVLAFVPFFAKNIQYKWLKQKWSASGYASECPQSLNLMNSPKEEASGCVGYPAGHCGSCHVTVQGNIGQIREIVASMHTIIYTKKINKRKDQSKQDSDKD